MTLCTIVGWKVVWDGLSYWKLWTRDPRNVLLGPVALVRVAQ